MLIPATMEDIQTYGDSAYALARDPAHSCYPTYADGIKTRVDFCKAAEKALTQETAELLLFLLEGSVAGWISYDWIPKDRYLQIDGCNIQRGTAQALSELLARLSDRFAGYTAYFGYPAENHEAIAFLQSNGFQCIEKSWNHVFAFGRAASFPCAPNIERISRRNFQQFRAVYHADSETYWNCDRIFETLDNWIIFVYRKADAPMAALFLSRGSAAYEVFGTVFADNRFQEDVFRDLLAAALNACREAGAKHLIYFCEDAQQHVLAELGFRSIGQYVLYTKTL